MLNRISYILLLGLLTLCAFLYITFARQEELPPARFVGVERCATCHEAASFGSQFNIWRTSAHASAYKRITSDSIQTLISMRHLNVDDCLRCHTTLGRAAQNTFEQHLLAEGVGCERCHGPGSNYSDFNTMTNRATFESRGGVQGSLADCAQCHRPASDEGRCRFQTGTFVADSAWHRIAHPVTASRRRNDTLLNFQQR